MNTLDLARENKARGNYIEAKKYYEKLISDSANEKKLFIYREYADILILEADPVNQSKGFCILYELACKGDLTSAGKVGCCFRDGIGIEVNVEKSIEFLQKGAKHSKWIQKELIKTLFEYEKFDELKSFDSIGELFDKEDYPIEYAESSIKGNRLIVNLKINNKKKHKANIYKDGNLVDYVFFDADIIEFEIKDSGIYYVEVVVYNESKVKFVTIPKSYYNDEFLNVFEIKTSLSNFDFEKDGCLLPFFESNYPYNDFVFVSSHKEGVFEDFLSAQFKISDKAILYSTRPSVSLGEKSVCLFSGYYHSNDELIYGVNDLESCKDFDSKLNGNFTFFLSDGDLIKVGADFFGLGKIFYSCINGDVFISNRYHLLLLALSKYGYQLELDKEQAVWILSLKNSMLSDQLINNDGLVRNTCILPVGKFIEFNLANEISLKSNGFFEGIAKAKNNYKFKDFIKDLNRAKNDIISNVKGIVHYEKFNRVAVDLTGGVDSRLVFAALTNIGGAKEKVGVITGGAKKDISVANTLAEKFKFKYDKQFPAFAKIKCRFDESVSINDYLNLVASHDLGTVFDASTFYPLTRFKDMARITGCFGEPISRPYMSQRMFNAFDKQDASVVIKNYYSGVLGRFAISGDDNFNIISKKLLKALDEKKESFDLNSRMEFLCLEYRARYHFDLSPKISWSTPSFAPLQSYSSLRALHGTLGYYASYKYVFELLRSLNKDIVDVEFESFRDSVECITYGESNKSSYIKDSGFSEDFLKSLEGIDNIKINGLIFDDYQKYFLSKDDSEFRECIFKKTMSYISYIYRNNILDKNLCLDLFNVFSKIDKKSAKGNSEIKSLFKKLSSIFNCWVILNKDCYGFEVKSIHQVELGFDKSSNGFYKG